MTPAKTTTGRKRLHLLLAVLAALVILVAGFVIDRMLPRSDVPMPATTASAREVVETYIRAWNARDFETSNALWTPPEEQSWTDQTGKYDQVNVVRTADHASGADVLISFVPDGLSGFESGVRTQWSFHLVHRSDGWRIDDEGIG